MKGFSNILKFAILVIVTLLFWGDTIAQSRYYGNKYNITAEFDTLDFEIAKGEVISKILKIVNKGDRSLQFALDLTFPKEWRTLNPRNRQYNLAPGDSIFVPVRIVPLGKTRGNTSYLIYAYIINGDEVPVASAHFLASRKKIVNWELNVDPGESLYFKNGERELEFSLNLMNTGNEETDFILDVSKYRKDRLLLTDTNDRVIKKPAEFALNELEDKTFYYKVRNTSDIRNYKRIDVENYNPIRASEMQKYSLFATTRESALTGRGEIVKGKKIDFIRLPNFAKANLYRRSSIPLVLDANMTNIVGQGQPTLGIGLRGNTMLSNSALLTYSSFNSFNTYIGSTRFLTDGFYYVGYYDKKFNISSSSGPGAKYFTGYYRIDKRNSVSSSYLRGPTYFGKASRTSFTLNYQHRGDKFSHGVQLNRFTSSSPGVTTNMARYSVSYPFMIGHNIGLSVGVANNIRSDPDPLASFDKTGFQLGLNYGGRYLKNKLTSTLNATLYSKDYSVYGNGNTLGLNHMSRYTLSRNWNVTLSNRYFDNRNLPQIILYPAAKYILFTNQATFSRQIGEHSLTSEVFYNMSNVDTTLNHSRGLGFGVSKFNLQNNQLIALNIRGGYNRIVSEPDPRDIFFAQFFALFKYRTWSGNMRYNYGSSAPLPLLLGNGQQFPQTLGGSVSNQYRFANPHFLLEHMLIYNYYNTFDRQTVGYTPDFYFFTNSGWRLRLTSGFYVSSSSGQNQFLNTVNSGAEDGEPKRKIATNFYLNFGVRKEFGIPMPWVKTVYPTVKFIAFLDYNGDGKKNQDEPPLENVVIRFGELELLSDLGGMATVQNVEADSSYDFSVISLVDLKGYFAKIENKFLVVDDSVMMIPFVKGIKVYGNVYVDREKMAPGALDDLNLGRIMIHASDHGLTPTNTLTNNDGSFQFYLPYGEYTISVDDRILGDNFRILQNDIDVDLDEMSDGMFISFYIVERRRKVNIKKFNGNGEVINGSERTVQPEEPDGVNAPGGSGSGSGSAPGGAGTTPDSTGQPDGSSDNVTDPGSTDTSGSAEGASEREGRGDVSLRDPSDNISVDLENKSITWDETEYYIVASAFTQQDDAVNYINTLEGQDNSLIVRSKDGLQFLVVFAYRTEEEARMDLASRKSVVPAAWITKKE